MRKVQPALRVVLPGLLLSAAAFSCSLLDPGGDGLHADRPLLRTDRDRYEAIVRKDGKPRVELTIPLTTVNTTSKEILLIGCHRPSLPVLEKYVDGEWVLAYAPSEMKCLSPPWRFRPGETFHDTLHVVGFFPGTNAAPTFKTEVDGTYRLVRQISVESEGKMKLLPLSLRISNIFQVAKRQN